MNFKYRRLSVGKVMPYIDYAGRLMLIAFFRKIFVNNRDYVQPDKPVLLACNHPTAFVDPCLLCVYVEPPIYNMTRGDVFKKPFFRALMESINMFPVYRIKDGFGSRDRNDEVFDFCFERLKSGNVITIYVEGEHHLDKQVRPVKKGIAHIAFEAYAKEANPEMQIVPSACNYWDGAVARDVVHINFGPPLYIKDYWAQYQANPSQTVQQLCADIRTAIQKLAIHVDDPADYKMTDQALMLLRNGHALSILPVTRYDAFLFTKEKELNNRLNGLSTDNKAALAHALDQYFNQLAAASVDDAALMHPEWGARKWLPLFVLLFPFFIIGHLSTWPLGWYIRRLARTRVKKLEFYTSVLMGSGFILSIFFYLLIFLSALISMQPAWIGVALSLPSLGYFAILYREQWRHWVAARKALAVPERAQLLETRKAVLAQMGTF